MTSEAGLVAIKAPPFLETETKAWFVILESQFHLRQITTEETKFYYTIASLPPEVISQIPEEVITSSSYSDVKAEIIRIHERTRPELFEKLISTTKLTGRPSTFLQEISKTASKVGVNDDLVRHKFIQSLPPAVAPAIAAQKDLSLVQLGKLADELLPLMENQCFNISRPTSSRTPSTPCPSSVRPFYRDQRPAICRAQIYFGSQARSCRKWCKWPNKSNSRILPDSRPGSPSTSRPSSPQRTPQPPIQSEN